MHCHSWKGIRGWRRGASSSPYWRPPRTYTCTFSIKINHLPKEITDEDLRGHFQHFGLIESIHIRNGGDENYAFLNYLHEDSAQRAAVEMNGRTIKGKRLSVIFGDSSPLQFTVKVENLSKQINERKLEQEFSLGGRLTIRSSKVVPCSNGPVNYAYVNYTTKHEAEIAVANFQQKVIDGSMIKVKIHSQERSHFSHPPSLPMHFLPPVPLPQGSVLQTTIPPRAKSTGTLKVSIYGNNIIPDDLEAVFAGFGAISEKPNVQPGTPNFAYINFVDPDHAVAAYRSFGSEGVIIKGTRITVKLPAMKGQQQPQNIVCDSVPCDRLVAKFVQAEAEIFITKHELNATITCKPAVSGGLNICGDQESLLQVKEFAGYLVPPLEQDIAKEEVVLHSLFVPAFANPKIVETLEKMQQEHAFLLTVAGPSENIQVTEFHNIAKKELADASSADNPQSSNSPQIATFLATPAQCQWLWENDGGGYTLYSPDVCDQLNKHFAMPPSSRDVCKIGPPLLPQSYTINVDTLLQTNDRSRRQRKIMRESQSTFTVAVSALNTSVPKMLLHGELDKHVGTLKVKLPSSANEALKSRLLDIAKRYFVRAQADSEMVTVEGVKEYINKIEIQLKEEILAHKSDELARIAAKASATFDTPDNWEPQSEKIELKTVAEGSSEYNTIQSRVLETLPSAKILKLERIQNQWLWEKHTFSKQRMTVKNRGDVNEKELFHGTRGTPPEKIFKSEPGFDFRFASNGMWGTGTYFAVNARYSDDYAYSARDSKKMILAKVLTGETYRCHPNGGLKKPPVKSQLRGIHSSSSGDSGEVFEDERYDSVSGHANGSDIYVIYDHDKAYPAYLITYRTATIGRLY